MNQIIFGFKPIRGRINISEEIVNGLTIGEKVLLESNISQIDEWLKSLTHEFVPMMILGIGKYSGKDTDKMRLESLCTNKFKNEFVDYPYKVTTEIRGFLKPSTILVKTFGMGNSFCNYTSYQLMKLINFKKIKAKYSFINVPKNYDINTAQEFIRKLLIENTTLQ